LGPIGSAPIANRDLIRVTALSYTCHNILPFICWAAWMNGKLIVGNSG